MPIKQMSSWEFAFLSSNDNKRVGKELTRTRKQVSVRSCRLFLWPSMQIINNDRPTDRERERREEKKNIRLC